MYSLRALPLILLARNDSPAPAAPAPCRAIHLPGQNLAVAALFVLPLGHAGPHAHHADELPLDDAANALDLVSLVARPQLRRGRPLMADLVNDGLDGAV